MDLPFKATSEVIVTNFLHRIADSLYNIKLGEKKTAFLPAFDCFPLESTLQTKLITPKAKIVD